MKSKLIRLISLILTLACILSAFVVFAYAEEPVEGQPTEGEGGEEEETEPVNLLLYRSFDEGWPCSNGLPIAGGKDGNFHVDYEETEDGGYNYYWAVSTQGVLDAFSSANGITGQQYVIWQFDIKAKDLCSSGNMYGRVNSGTSAPNIQFYSIRSGKLYLPQEGTYTANTGCSFEVGDLKDDWMHIVYLINFTDLGLSQQISSAKLDESYVNVNGELTRAKMVLEAASAAEKAKAQEDYDKALNAYYANEKVQLINELESQITNTATVTFYYGLASKFDINNEDTYETYSTIWERQESQSDYPMTNFETFRFGFPNGSVGRDDTYCLDNVALYTGTSTPRPTDEIAEMGYGSYVSPSAAKTVKILSRGEGGTSDADYLSHCLAMKNNVEYALLNDQRVALITDDNGVAYGAPQKINGKVMLPLQPILDFVGYPVYVHSDLISYDISTGKGASYITIGRDTASVNGERVELSVAPCILTDKKTGNPYAAICIDDVKTIFSGFYATYDDMGLTIICKKENLYNRKDNLMGMVELMKQFVFDEPTGEDVYNAVKEHTNGFQHPYLLADQSVFDGLHEIYTADQADPDFNAKYYRYAKRAADVAESYFKKMAIDNGSGFTEYVGIRPELYTYSLDYLNQCYREAYKKDYNPNTNNDSFFSKYYLLYNIYETRWGGTNYGYDPDGGRNNLAPSAANWMLWLALGYQVTHELKYAELAYDIGYQLITWETWGEGHFLNCADASAPYSQAFDWCYNIWKELGDKGEASKTFKTVYSVDHLAQGLYDLGISKGYISTHGSFSINRLTNGKQTISAWSSTGANNWNAVCTSGMTNAVLALMEYFDDEGTILKPNAEAIQSVTKNTMMTAKDQAFALTKKMLHDLFNYGLDEYAPDGGYIESPGYWNYGTSNFFEMVMALKSATGDDFGFMDCWGIDTTCNFACQTEYPVGAKGGLSVWSYHDSGSGRQDKSCFYFVGQFYEDEGLIAIRKKQLDGGLNPEIFDIVNYKPSFEELDTDNVALDLDYYGQGIDLFCSRSDWNDGCIYTGFIGGSNNCSHNNVDAGTFLYVNKNFEWFCELGSDQYNVYNYFGNSNWRNSYYRLGGEGQNHVIVTSQSAAIPYGQKLEGTGTMTDTFINEHGSYAKMDLITCYGDIASYARRGMLFTNDRKTVVYQDEIAFGSVENFAWIGHTKATKIVLSGDKTVAYLIQTVNGQEVIIRAAIVSNTTSAYKFEIRDCYNGYYENGSSIPAPSYMKNGMTIRSDYLLETTIDTLNPNAENSLKYCAVDENDRHSLLRLVIERSGVTCDLAVVIEEVDEIDSEMPIGYNFTPMSEWEPVAATEQQEVDVGKLAPLAQWISTYGDSAFNSYEKNRAFSTRYKDFFSDMHMAAVAVDNYKSSINSFRKSAPKIWESYQNYLITLDAQERFVKEMNKEAAVIYNLVDALSGFKG